MGIVLQLKQVSSEKLEDFKKDSSQLSDFLFKEDDTYTSIYLDKSWQAIHFVLAGNSWDSTQPIGKAILGGTAIGDDMGYGPARYIDSEEIKQIASALSKMSENEFNAMLDLELLSKNQIYPMIDRWKEDDRQYLLQYFTGLKQWYVQTAQKGYAAFSFHC